MRKQSEQSPWIPLGPHSARASSARKGGTRHFRISWGTIALGMKRSAALCPISALARMSGENANWCRPHPHPAPASRLHTRAHTVVMHWIEVSRGFLCIDIFRILSGVLYEAALLGTTICRKRAPLHHLVSYSAPHRTFARCRSDLCERGR